MRQPTRPTIAAVSLSVLSDNLTAIQRRVGDRVRVMPVVKANAYGHGSVRVASHLEQDGWPMLGVAFAEEGEELRRSGITCPIHVFALSGSAQAVIAVRQRLEPTVATVDGIRLLQRLSSRARRTIDVHLKIDTGMNRIGARMSDLASIGRALSRARRIRVKGIFTHFATADVPGSPFVSEQLDRFMDAVDTLGRMGIEADLIHASNSGAILHRPDARFSMVRAGILMYGYSPTGPGSVGIPVRPALGWSTTVAQVKRIAAGESVSYGRRFIAARPTTIATIPVGYADGLSRALTGKAEVLVNGRRRKVVGTICMDQCMVNCGNDDVRVGDRVVLIGSQGTHTLTAWDMARSAGTIPYEVTCAISARVPRVYHS